MPNAEHAAPLEKSVQEVQGVFPNDAALQDAIGRLTRLGFDRAGLSLPAANPAPYDATPESGAEDPNTEDDSRQARTLHSSMAASVGAMIGAGVTVATGGAALLAGAAALGVGAVAGGATAVAQTAGTNAVSRSHDESAAQGQLVLSALAPDADAVAKARVAMQQAGASRVETVTRHSATIASRQL